MTLLEYDKRLEKTIKDLQTKNSLLMPKLGVSALTLIKERVIKTGVDAKGSKFKAYSTKPMLIGAKSFPTKAAGDKVFGSKAKRKELDWRTLGEGEAARRLAILKGGYKQWRQIMGAQVGHVDFMVSGRMWANINLVSSASDHAKGIAIIGAKEDNEKKKLAGNTARKGDILDLNGKEIEDLYQAYHLNTIQIFKENGI
jgi:hypothetical protein